MITDERRHEVAQKLRALDMSDIEVDGCIIDSPKYVGLLLMRMLDAACDYRDGLHHFPGFFSAQAVVELFAELIDRPMCHDLVEHKQDPFIPGKQMADGYFHCSSCDWSGQLWEYIGFGDMLAYEPVHCPMCGAVITDVKR